MERIVHHGSPSEGLGEVQTQPGWNLLVSGTDCASLSKGLRRDKQNQVVRDLVEGIVKVVKFIKLSPQGQMKKALKSRELTVRCEVHQVRAALTTKNTFNVNGTKKNNYAS